MRRGATNGVKDVESLKNDERVHTRLVWTQARQRSAGNGGLQSGKRHEGREEEEGENIESETEERGMAGGGGVLARLGDCDAKDTSDGDHTTIRATVTIRATATIRLIYLSPHNHAPHKPCSSSNQYYRYKIEPQLPNIRCCFIYHHSHYCADTPL